jgi:Leucine-rich repeat (LRR) protein
MICSSCLLIEYLDIRFNDLITVEGLNNIHCLIHLKSLSLDVTSDDWLAKLSHCTALTQLDLDNSTVSDEGLLQLSSLVKLTSVDVNGQKRVLRKIL